MPETVDEVFEAAVQKVEDGITRVKEILDDITVVVPPVIDKLPPLVKGFAQDKFDALVDRVTEVYDMLNLFYTERGSASAVRTVADRWVTEVGALTSAQAGYLQLSQLPSNSLWAGPAAGKYTNLARNQAATLGQLNPLLTEKLQSQLHEIADAIRNFWSGLATAYLVWATAMVGCLAGGSTGVGLVPALVGALGVTSVFLNELRSLSNDFTNAIDTNVGKLRGLNEERSVFTGDKWPPTTTGYETLSDASVRDGDGSEWALAESS